MKVKIYNTLKRTSGGLHSWVDSNVGVIRKENKNIPVGDATVIGELREEPIIKWYLRFWNWIKKLWASQKKQPTNIP